MQSRSSPCRMPGAAHLISLAVMAAALVAGGCAAHPGGPSRVAGPTVPTSGEPAALSGWSVQTVKADGYPIQRVLRTPTTGPDDQREPWSPNYGSARSPSTVATDAGLAATRIASAAAREPWPTLKIVPRPADPDDVIRRAIAEHEMRQR